MIPNPDQLTNKSARKLEPRGALRGRWLGPAAFALLAGFAPLSARAQVLSVPTGAASIRAMAASAIAADVMSSRMRLPSALPMGAAMIHRYEEPRVNPPLIAVTVWVPMNSAEMQGRLVNMNALLFPVDLPRRFVIGDGGATRAFLGIDLAPGSPLALLLGRVLELVGPGAGDEDVIEFLRARTNELIEWTVGSRYNDGRKELPWDLAIPAFKSNLAEVSARAALEALFHYPLESGEALAVVGLEHYLAAGKGYCLEKALLASLVLSRAGVRHRLVNGAVSLAPGISGGHTWIELEDGRVLDPAWEVFEAPGRGHPLHADWIKIGGQWRYENQNYLALVLE